MANTSYDGTMLAVAGQGAAVDGDWWAPVPLASDLGSITSLVVTITLTAGTGTWVLEGRNDFGAGTQIDTGTANKVVTALGYKHYRLRWTAAAGLTATAASDHVLRNVVRTRFAAVINGWYNNVIGGFWPDRDAVDELSFMRSNIIGGDATLLAHYSGNYGVTII